MGTSNIEWLADSDKTQGKTWNPITGCTPCRKGCVHCYARRMAQRLAGRFGYPKDDPFRVTFHRDRLDEPRHWRKPRRVFVCSMGDLWHKDVDPLDRAAVIRATNLAPQHTYIFLTGRPEALDVNFSGCPNFWLGTSASTQAECDRNVEHLLRCPAAIRFVSLEPLLGPINIYNDERDYLGDIGRPGGPPVCRGLDWVIVGAESGPGARPMYPEWVRGVRNQCVAASVPFFFKQWGDAKPDVLEVQSWRRAGRDFAVKKGGRILDGKVWDQYPEGK